MDVAAPRPARHLDRPAPTRDTRSEQRAAQTRVRTAPAVRTGFQQACQTAGLTVQEALEMFMTRGDELGWIQHLAHHRQHARAGGEYLKPAG